MRTPTPEDAGALLELFRRSLPFDTFHLGLIHEKIWGDPDYAPERTLYAEEGAFGMAVRRPDGRCCLKLLLVDPERRRRGLGGELLGRLLATLDGPVRVWESHPNYLLPGQDVRYTDGLLFLQKHRFERFTETFNMLCPLESEFPEDNPTGCEARRARHSDRPALLAFLEEHFAIWRSEVETMLGNDPVSVHLGLREDQVVAFAGYDGNNLGTGWFGPMGTHPGERGLGLGGILLRRCLNDIRRQGHVRAIIPWVGPYPFYTRQCGAHLDRVFWRMERR